MRQDRGSRRPPLLQRLFAERQVYLRSGQDSRYVALSRPFQMGVTLVVLAVIGGLAFASYSSVANHLEAMERSRELARLEGVNKSLRAAAETSPANEEVRAAAEQVPRLEAALDEARAARARAEQLAEASAAEAEELRRELELAEQRVQRVTESLAEAQEERDALAERLAARQEVASDQAGGDDEAAALRAELEDAAERVATLSAERSRLQEQVEQLGTQTDASDQQIAALTTRLEETQATIADLQEALEGVQVADDAALDERLSEARAQIERLSATIEEVRAQPVADVVAAADQPGAEEAPQQLSAALERSAQLQSELAQANQRIEELQAELEGARTEVALLQTQVVEPAAGPASGDEGAALVPGQGDDGPDAAPSPVALRGEETIAALTAELAAAKEALEAVREDAQGDGDLAGLEDKLNAAGERIDQLDAVLERMKAREAAINLAMSNLAPPPPPPAPR